MSCLRRICIASFCLGKIITSSTFALPSNQFSSSPFLRSSASNLAFFPSFCRNFSQFEKPDASGGGGGVLEHGDGSCGIDNGDYNVEDDEENFDFSKEPLSGGEMSRELGVVLEILRTPRKSCSVMKHRLEQCGVSVSSQDFVVEVLSQVRNDWEAAFTFFVWCGKQPGYSHSLRAYHSMISILGKMRKFDTAWGLIDEMKGGETGNSIVTPHTLLIMIRRYCAAHDVGKAISTFYAHKRFNLKMGMEEFQGLLSALCRYKNVKDAEHLLLCNKHTFRLNTKSFNIILNGWCNIICSPREGKRIWQEMIARGVKHDVVSYASLISCYSKCREVDAVTRIFNELKATNISPDRKIYNAVIHALAKAKQLKEASSLMKEMEEKGIAPNAVTYNSLIMPLCRAYNLNEARNVFKDMLERGLVPTVRTYQALFHILRPAKEVFALLQQMNQIGCYPDHDTYTMLIRKFCRWRQIDNVFKLWTDMSKNGLVPDRSSYNTLARKVQNVVLRIEDAIKPRIVNQQAKPWSKPDYFEWLIRDERIPNRCVEESWSGAIYLDAESYVMLYLLRALFWRISRCHEQLDHGFGSR